MVHDLERAGAPHQAIPVRSENSISRLVTVTPSSAGRTHADNGIAGAVPPSPLLLVCISGSATPPPPVVPYGHGEDDPLPAR